MSFVRNEEEEAQFGTGSYANYKYNGKELQETGMIDYGWRQYMSDIGRWNGIDQLAEMYASTSTYAYVANNPVMRFDVDGRWFNDDGTIDTSGRTPGFISGKQYKDSFLGANKNDGGGGGGSLWVGDLSPDNGVTLGDLIDAWLSSNSTDDILSVANELMDEVQESGNLSPNDVIFLIDSKAVGGLGHAAVLIGSEKDGWYYYSLNGTGGDKGRPYGDAKGSDVGTNLGKVSMAEAIKRANTINADYTHHYDNNLALLSSPSEDKAMMKVAAKAASVNKYILTDQDCLTVPMAAFNQLRHMRLGGGPQTAKIPNAWRFSLPLYISVINMYLPSASEIKYK